MKTSFRLVLAISLAVGPLISKQPALTGRTRFPSKPVEEKQGATSRERPPLFFREDWKETPAVTPVTQAEVNNPDLLLAVYGRGKDHVRKSHHDHPARSILRVERAEYRQLAGHPAEERLLRRPERIVEASLANEANGTAPAPRCPQTG